MTYDELERKLKKAGWKKGHGSKHDFMFHPNRPGIQITFGRHKTEEVARGTLQSILRDAGLK